MFNKSCNSLFYCCVKCSFILKYSKEKQFFFTEILCFRGKQPKNLKIYIPLSPKIVDI
jgi:hypothetical protein